MAHPFSDKRQGKVEHSRVASITKGYASGGGVHSDEPADKRLVRKMVKATALKLHGGSVGQRADRPNRAAGGLVNNPMKTRSPKRGKKGATTVNVIIAGGGEKESKPPIMPPMMPPPKPPMAGPPPGAMPPPGGVPMPSGPGLPPPPMGRARGGKVAKDEKVPLPPRDPRKIAPDDKGQINVGSGVGYKKGGKIKRADGGKVSDASEGKTPVQPQNVKETELKNTGRGRVVTA